MKKDRVTAGVIAGFIGSVIQEGYAWLAKFLGFSKIDFADFAGVMTMFRNFNGPLALFIQWMAHIATGIMFGAIFAIVFMYTSSKYWLIKGISYGLVLWVLLMGVGMLFKMPMWTEMTPQTALNMLVGSVIFTVTTAIAMKLLDEKTKLI